MDNSGARHPEWRFQQRSRENRHASPLGRHRVDDAGQSSAYEFAAVGRRLCAAARRSPRRHGMVWPRVLANRATHDPCTSLLSLRGAVGGAAAAHWPPGSRSFGCDGGPILHTRQRRWRAPEMGLTRSPMRWVIDETGGGLLWDVWWRPRRWPAEDLAAEQSEAFGGVRCCKQWRRVPSPDDVTASPTASGVRPLHQLRGRVVGDNDNHGIGFPPDLHAESLWERNV